MALRNNELMIGDWVLINGTPRKIQAVNDFDDEIIADGDLYSLAEDRYHSEDRVEGVLLQPEILDKNGFADISDHTLKGAETYRLSINQNDYNYTITIKLRDWFRLTSFDDREYTLCQINFGFKYVHKLQHALRLCGIEKSIEL